MNDTLKWVLIGLGAYLLYEQYAASPAAITTTGTPVTPPPTPPSTTPTATASPSTPPAQAVAMAYRNLLQSAGQSGILQAAAVPASQLYNSYQWNYYLPAIGIQYQPTDADMAKYGVSNMNTAIPVSTWYSAALAYFTAASNSPTGMGAVTAKKTPLIPVTFDLQQTGW